MHRAATQCDAELCARRLASRLSEQNGGRRAVAGSRTLSPTPARREGSNTHFEHCGLAHPSAPRSRGPPCGARARARPGCDGGHAAPGLRRDADRHQRQRPDRDGVRPRRQALHRRAGRPPARRQERDAARDAVRHPDRRSERRARAPRRRDRPGLRLERVRLPLLHGDDTEHAQPRQPLHRVGRRRRGGQRASPARSEPALCSAQPQRRRPPLRQGRQALRCRR